MKQPISITGLMLRRQGDHAIVEVEVEGVWVEIIKEHLDGNFSHIVEPAGIRQCITNQDASGVCDTPVG